MKKLILSNRTDVYNAPIISWNNDTYTPLSNKQVMDLIDTKIHDLGLTVKHEEYRVSRNVNDSIKGVIGSYDITTDDGEFGQRIMFRNSYDKSMSFAFVCGSVVWICTNGCISGDYQYKRVHRGTFTDDSSTTIQDVISNINGGFSILQKSFEHNVQQLNALKTFEVSPTEAFKIIGELFFNKEVISVNQVSLIKKEFDTSNNFRHLGDLKFTAFDLYNHITEALKTSHPLTYINDHVETHKLFETTFDI